MTTGKVKEENNGKTKHTHNKKCINDNQDKLSPPCGPNLPVKHCAVRIAAGIVLH